MMIFSPITFARRPAALTRKPSFAASPQPQPKDAERYRFLDEPDCPVELHTLVGRRISMYHEYNRAYRQLRDCRSLDECTATARRVIDAYIDNQQCWKELEYYRRHHQILGRHPLLRHLKGVGLLRAMTVRQLMEERQRTKDNIWRAKNEIAKGTKPHLDEKRLARIREHELRLQEINNLLGDE